MSYKGKYGYLNFCAAREIFDACLGSSGEFKETAQSRRSRRGAGRSSNRAEGAHFKIAQRPVQRSPWVISSSLSFFFGESGYEEREGDRYSKLQYEAKQLKEWGASGTKLLLYFDPQGKSAEHQIDVAKTALEASRGQNIPLFLEVVTYGKTRDSASAGEATLQAMRMLLARGVKPDVWKLEFPGSAELAKEITELAADTPWILLTRGVSFEQFAKELQTSVENGARGFLAGRAVWQEVMEFRGEEQEKFLNETVPSRFRKISQIAFRV
ncbi:MAG: Tagatose-1,6-bisphosphate aldolase [Candidatus Kaiserbacteria bacterium GW2011_GWC2_52_8b]|uniref:Tagatose-1,6-bisphosphate aldolase n=1 Tax=Candidatus Kaiserbacteria bacterium GW2011_GWC2_52_8b TaxID=1618676 RepID=A0A0G1XF43_9BACT|nr:MAG: Tagatose-1,6-bisphosphate aldolase [Candidatus Kaiserbacteria bacterium GW2011_GWC2_52_8b]